MKCCLEDISEGTLTKPPIRTADVVSISVDGGPFVKIIDGTHHETKVNSDTWEKTCHSE